MQRWKLTIEYNGGPFVGWQRQPNGPTIQAALEAAVFAFCGEEAGVQGAGRTDTGVHALAQVAHVDIARQTTARTVRDAINQHLKPNPIAVTHVEPVTEDFHARFSATGRAYLYRILNRRAPAALDIGRVWPVPRDLDVDAMHAAAQRLVGLHDFTSFRAAECQAASPIKTLDRLDVSRVGEEIHIVAEARSFLHHQIRNFAGTLERVGRGKWTPDDVSDILNAKDRAVAGPTAPPQGLYLTRVSYDT
ncbi:MAG: tRNA pseudouridine(38-40) synthase TruA [Rhodospirillales bacterium]|jgi:tRNA pseudouridine38-40 synthase|uniref:tRNA pseudouridine(38-40) synthase TruA n=1 Tax=Hwanghaeella sp. 1Z406 TaxID=3402811 RepID=UPI000C8A200B|nr:tRNA pseudouridine(38-40) synthase TruA [Rhodospirillales bacterium]|tara:strand:+ start:92988 stop:93731 length:744 start_codon:yes stop_codon:yes gene_type:complete